MTVFVAVAERQSFAAAARALGLSPPVVTRTVAALESHLGSQLLVRNTRRVMLTEAGVRYLEYCRQILAQIAEAEAAASGAHADPRGLVTLTASILFGEIYAAPIVRTVLDDHPAMRARLMLTDRILNLVDEGVDIAIRLGDLPDSALKSARVGAVRKVVVASPTYLERNNAPQTPQDLTRHRVAASTGIPLFSDWRGEGGAPIKLELAPQMQTTTVQSAMDAALSGWGMTRVLSYMAAPHLAAGRLRIVLEAFEPPPKPIHVLHVHGAHAPARVRVLFDALVAGLRADKTLSVG